MVYPSDDAVLKNWVWNLLPAKIVPHAANGFKYRPNVGEWLRDSEASLAPLQRSHPLANRDTVTGSFENR